MNLYLQKGLTALADIRRAGGLTLLALLAPSSSAQDLTWIRQFGTNRYDRADAAAPDGSGGVYAAGYTYGSFGGPSAGEIDAWLTRFDAAGSQLWLRQFGTTARDFAQAATPDGAGGVYISGRTFGDLAGVNAGGEDAWLARYDAAGNRSWVVQLGTAGDDSAAGVAADGAGGVYLAGHTEGSLGIPYTGVSDIWLAHYDGSGNQTWLRQFGSLVADTLYGAAADGAGGVFLCGRGGTALAGVPGGNTGNGDAWFLHYDAAGGQSWLRGVASRTTDTAHAIVSDGSGGAFVGGWSQGPLGVPSLGGYDAWLAHYDGAGSQNWLRVFGTNNFDSIYALAPDGAGGVLSVGVTGASLGAPNAGDFDAWLGNFDSAGIHTWTRQFGTATADFAQAIAIDGTGGVFVVGLTGGALGGPSAGHSDVYVARFDDHLGPTRYCTPAVANSTGQPAALSATGHRSVLALDLTLLAGALPPHAFGYFVAGQTPGLVANPGGSQGNLCIAGPLGRMNGPGQVLGSGASGWIALTVDLTSMPTAAGPVPVQPGDTWSFQAWYRDAHPGPTSNFTDAVSVLFQ